MKKYEVTYHENGITHTAIIEAISLREASQKAWSMFDVDDIDIRKVTNNEQAEKGR